MIQKIPLRSQHIFSTDNTTFCGKKVLSSTPIAGEEKSVPGFKGQADSLDSG